MALIIENISGALLNVNDLGFALTIGSTIDLSIENDPLTVSFSASAGGDLNNLITSGSIVVKDPNDDVTNLSITQGIIACRAHNEPTYELMRLTGNVTQTANGVKLFLDRIIHGPASVLDFIETGGGVLTVGFQAPVSLVAPVLWTLPDADAVTSGDVLTSNAAGILSWTTIVSAPDQNLWETFVADTGSTSANTITDSLTIAGGAGISTTIVGDIVTIDSTGTPPGGVDSNIQYNNGGIFGGNSAFNFNDVALQVDILGNALDTQLTVGGDAQVLSGETNATLYVEVAGGGLSDEAARFYWNRGAGISGWITYDYDGAAPSIRIVDEDDDPTSITFQVVGTGTDLAPEFDNRFGGRGPTAGATTGFSWEVNNTEVAIMDTNFMDITSVIGEYRVNGSAIVANNLADVDTVTTVPIIGDALEFDGTNWVPVTPMRPTFCIFAEENSSLNVSLNNYEFSYGNGAVNTADADPSGIPMGVNCTLIGLGISGHGTGGATTVSISITNNGTTVATGGIASAIAPAKFQNFTTFTPDTVNFVPGDTLQFITASETGGQRDVRVVAWFERTS